VLLQRLVQWSRPVVIEHADAGQHVGCPFNRQVFSREGDQLAIADWLIGWPTAQRREQRAADCGEYAR
jgi:hypothetical protein